MKENKNKNEKQMCINIQSNKHNKYLLIEEKQMINKYLNFLAFLVIWEMQMF